MDHRIIKYYAGELSKEERKALLQEAFSNQELKKEMINCQHLQSLVKLHPQEKNELLGKESLKRFMKARQIEKKKRLSFHFLRYAAIIIACIVSTWWVTYSFISMEIPQPVTQELSVPAGQRAHIVLPDGSKVWVNAGSTLTYPSIFGEERRVKLNGEAFFEVAKGTLPFIVSTGKVDIKALGTQFNVFNYPSEELTVALLEGSVRVYHPEQEQQGVLLSPEQQLTATANGRFLVGSITKDPIIWKDGLYAFDKQKLKDILKKLELYYDVKIIVKDTSILEYEYTGKFRQRDRVMEVLRIIQKIHPFKIKQKENTNEITLYR